MRKVRMIRRALPVAMIATSAIASFVAVVGVGTTVWGSGIRSSKRFIPVRSEAPPEFLRRFYQDTSGHWPARSIAVASRAMDILSEHTLTFHADDENELANVMLAVNNMNGAVVMPGEVFSFNGIVGERTEERGFRPGWMYEGGRLVSGVGGGVCIPSTALYNAALYAGMEIVERYNHSGPVSYAEPGLDAAVVFGQKDFRFRNTAKEPVTIEARVEGDALTVMLRGHKVAGRRVVVETTGFGRLAFAEETVTDAEVPAGAPEVEQEGRSGFVVTVVRTVFEGGKVVRRETVSHDVVAARNRITRMNPLDDPASPEAIAKAKEETALAEAEAEKKPGEDAIIPAASAASAAPAAPATQDEPVAPLAPVTPVLKDPVAKKERPAAEAIRPVDKAPARPAAHPEKVTTKPAPKVAPSEPVKPDPVRVEAPKFEPKAAPVVAIEPPVPAPASMAGDTAS